MKSKKASSQWVNYFLKEDHWAFLEGQQPAPIEHISMMPKFHIKSNKIDHEESHTGGFFHKNFSTKATRTKTSVSTVGGRKLQAALPH